LIPADGWTTIRAETIAMFSPADLSRIHALGPAKFLLRVETSSRAEDYAKYETLRNAVWDFPDDRLAGTRNLLCENFCHDGTSLFIAAYAARPDGAFDESAERMAGFSYGFVGLRDKDAGFRSPDNLWFYSQYTGVRPEAEGFGLGVAIKEFQRDVLRRVYGIFTVVCTCDPLSAVNAHRNIRRFGMSVLEYRAAAYGEFGGRLNRSDVPSDRFFMSWDLGQDAAPAPSAPGGLVSGAPLVLSVGRKPVLGRSGRAEIEIAGALDLAAAGDRVRLPIPADFYALLQQTDVDDPAVRRIPLDWRLRTREAFQALFGRGFRVVDFLDVLPCETGPSYLLQRS
jgi:predicted GNAT superfamily acetyltransferase